MLQRITSFQNQLFASHCWGILASDGLLIHYWGILASDGLINTRNMKNNKGIYLNFRHYCIIYTL